ncbi:hypothetical protein [Embleya scabrispora]|uniref:hypothetical protein n=1 Tax=Embleya scabrispora TaxID=159449 RepID=UPI001319EA28|nr:hypothetical protein [Embleya scabrispora]MYS82093.1 hypothetical protein [Streptomyces sp. SID5474]
MEADVWAVVEESRRTAWSSAPFGVVAGDRSPPVGERPLRSVALAPTTVRGADPLKDALRGRSAVAGLIRHPQPDSAGENPSAALQAAAREWIDPETLSPLVARWMPIARGTAEAVDALVGLIETASEPWQAATGLQWIDELIGDNHAAVASRSWRLVPWLEALSTSSHLRPPSLARLRHIVDGLATHGDSRAAALQRLDG